MVFVQLSDEEKLQVLLLAFSLFLLALIVSICLAATSCPLNRWLLERHSKRGLSHCQRRRRQQQQQQPQAKGTHKTIKPPGYLIANLRNQSQNYRQQHQKRPPLNQNPVFWADYPVGPPPAYGAAAPWEGRLHGEPSQGADWLHGRAPLSAVFGAEKELDFGDYFHPPKEEQIRLPMMSIRRNQLMELDGEETAVQSQRQLEPPPIMLRLWVKMMDPGELVGRVREIGQTGGAASNRRQPGDAAAAGGSCRRLSRQLSIPHLFGSLVTLAGKLQMSGQEQNLSQAGAEPQASCCLEVASAGGADMSSITSTSTTSSSSGGSSLERPTGNSTAGSPHTGLQEETFNKTGASDETKPANTRPNHTGDQAIHEGPSVSPITSRVLHMNVASFSYVKDESLISSKRHHQMNYHHFCKTNTNFNPSGSKQSTAGSGNKYCQLVVSICDIENVLGSSWLSGRSCALLANSSSVYIQCEILVPESKSARLLRYPLRALQQETTKSTHTVSFAAASGPVPVAPLSSLNPQVGPRGTAASCGPPPPPPEVAATANGRRQIGGPEPSGGESNCTRNFTNWRHEPSADGKSIVVFNSLSREIEPKQLILAQPQRPLSSAEICAQSQASATDLIQFDSVFVSPILSKSTVSDGFVKFRLYSQCKYVNETCLAELKLPLKQLLRSETGDNLGDAGSAGGLPNCSQRPQQQADLILNNLLANLVTASTSAPLSSLMEQISAESREQAANLRQQQQQQPSAAATMDDKPPPPANGPGFRFPWLHSATDGQQEEEQQQQPTGPLKSSCSHGGSLYQLSGLARQRATDEPEVDSEAEAEAEAEGLMEQNYCRSLMVSHWLNYLVAPSYECQPIEEPRGSIMLGLSYLPTSNRVIFNAIRANIDNGSFASGGKQMMKNLRLQSGTCYLLRFLMVANGRVVKRKQSQVGSKPEWDSQEPITFDLVSVSVEQPSFVVALVMRNATIGTGSLQNLVQPQFLASCGNQLGQQTNSSRRVQDNGRRLQNVQSEPESLQHFEAHPAGGSSSSSSSSNGGACSICRQELSLSPNRASGGFRKRDLVIGHLTLGEEIWREMQSQPRKQIVRQFKMY